MHAARDLAERFAQLTDAQLRHVRWCVGGIGCALGGLLLVMLAPLVWAMLALAGAAGCMAGALATFRDAHARAPRREDDPGDGYWPGPGEGDDGPPNPQGPGGLPARFDWDAFDEQFAAHADARVTR